MVTGGVAVVGRPPGAPECLQGPHGEVRGGTRPLLVPGSQNLNKIKFLRIPCVDILGAVEGSP